MRRLQPAAGGARQRTPSKSKTTGSLFSARAAALASWRLLLAFFLDHSESDVRPSDRAAARSLPSFTAMLLKRGQGSLFPSWRLLLVFFLDRSESDVRPSNRAAARSLPSFTAMLLKRGQGSVFPSWRLLLAFFLDRSESDVRPSDRAAAGSLPSPPRCSFLVNFWSSSCIKNPHPNTSSNNMRFGMLMFRLPT